MKTFTIPKQEPEIQLHTERLPVLDNGYFDVLVAIGYAALADAYYEGPSPQIRQMPNGFEVLHGSKLRERPNLSWLKYSLAASWKKEKSMQEGLMVKKDKAWDGEEVIFHNGAVVDTSDEPTIVLELGKNNRLITAPSRELYGVLNKLGSPKWLNACIHTCREKGIKLLGNQFKEKISFNSIVLPQSSKGGMSSSSFSIANGSLPVKFGKKWGREICLAVAGLLVAAKGSIKNGFALPVPFNITFSFLQHLVDRNRKRIVPKDFFFPYNNYLFYLRLLLAYGQKGKNMLSAVCGAKFIELGTQSSPAGVWSLRVPSYSYSLTSVDDLNNLLLHWRKSVKPKSTSEPNIDRLSVDRLMRGFEKGDVAAFVEGYLSYLETVGFKAQYLPILHQQQFFEIMNSNSKKYQELVETLRGPVLKPIINLIRQDTYNRVFKREGETSEPPDYQMIRKLREVQNSEDLVTAICEISIKRGIDKMASQNTQENAREKHNISTQDGIAKIIELGEDERYSPKLIAQLILALALSKASATSEE
ncbi:MAG: hypothetical protein J5I98_09520 [Phaeodactylibacter sp.]|nr:hypothetical protein [Phaeodactylibacter sp.]